jgi:hypothetical protein
MWEKLKNSKKLKWILIGVALIVFVNIAVREDHGEKSSTSSVSDKGRSASKSSLTAEEKADHEDDIVAEAKPLTQALPTSKERETRFGEVSVLEKNDGTEEIFYQGKPIGLEEKFVWLGPVLKGGSGKNGDLIIVELVNGGTGCPASFVLLTVTPDGASWSESFGDCSDYAQLIHRPDKMIVRIGKRAWKRTFYAGSELQRIRVSEAIEEEFQAALDFPSTDIINVIRPPIEADGKAYRWCGLLEQANMNDMRSAAGGIGSIFTVKMNDHYFSAVAVKEITKGVQLRIGGAICVTGVYSLNMPYETLGGRKKIMPLLEAHRFSHF